MRPPSFIVFGDDWGGHPSSVQHLFRRIARECPTLWVNTLGLRPPRLDRRDAARVVRKVQSMVSPRAARASSALGPTPPGLKLEVVSPPMLPWMRPDALRALNRGLVRGRVSAAARRMGLHAPIVVTTVPNGVDGAGLAGSQCLVYYCVDDFTNWPGVDAQAAASLEAELLDTCAAVLATSQALAETRVPRSGAVSLLPHGVDVAHLGRASDPSTPRLDGVSRGRPVVGYLGLVDARLDVPLVVDTARANPDYDFVFVGPTDTAVDPRLRQDNIRFAPAVPYARLPEALASFDVAWLPYVRSTLTKAINPLKLREYLASGRPVVATSLPEVVAFSPEVAIADTAPETGLALRAALSGERDRRGLRAASLASESWEARADTFLARVAEALRGRGDTAWFDAKLASRACAP